MREYKYKYIVYFYDITIVSLWYVKYHRFSNIIFYISQWNDRYVVEPRNKQCIYIYTPSPCEVEFFFFTIFTNILYSSNSPSILIKFGIHIYGFVLSVDTFYNFKKNVKFYVYLVQTPFYYLYPPRFPKQGLKWKKRHFKRPYLVKLPSFFNKHFGVIL